jgi:hypothetical protein
MIEGWRKPESVGQGKDVREAGDQPTLKERIKDCWKAAWPKKVEGRNEEGAMSWIMGTTFYQIL